MPAKHVLEARIEAPGAADTPMTALPIDGREPSTAQSAAMADIATTVRGPKSIDRIEFAKPSRSVRGRLLTSAGLQETADQRQVAGGT